MTNETTAEPLPAPAEAGPATPLDPEMLAHIRALSAAVGRDVVRDGRAYERIMEALKDFPPVSQEEAEEFTALLDRLRKEG